MSSNYRVNASTTGTAIFTCSARFGWGGAEKVS